MSHRKDNQSIEELRKMLLIFEKDAASLYRYGGLSIADIKFKTLSNTDQIKLLYLALTEGNKDVIAVAREIRRLNKITYSTADELVESLPYDDKNEIKFIEDSKSFSGIAIVDGTRSFNTSEKKLIISILSNLPRFHLQDLKKIRAEISTENWLGRFLSYEGIIELNIGWDSGTLLHEIGHVLHESLPQNKKDAWTHTHRGK